MNVKWINGFKLQMTLWEVTYYEKNISDLATNARCLLNDKIKASEKNCTCMQHTYHNIKNLEKLPRY